MVGYHLKNPSKICKIHPKSTKNFMVGDIVYPCKIYPKSTKNFVGEVSNPSKIHKKFCGEASFSPYIQFSQSIQNPQKILWWGADFANKKLSQHPTGGGYGITHRFYWLSHVSRETSGRHLSPAKCYCLFNYYIKGRTFPQNC
jgi:hypothetical protein